MKKCRAGANFSCHYVTNGGFCTLSEDMTCILKREYVEEAGAIVAGAGVKVSPDDINKIKIHCEEITLTKDSVGIEVKIQNLIQNIDKFETIEINGKVFKRVREE